MSCIPLRAACVALALCAGASGAQAGSERGIAPPFNARSSNTVPLVFGMDPASAAVALQTPLVHVGGRRGHDIYQALRDGGGGFFERRDRLFLQFRHGRLTGWKGDWGHNWMWR